VADEAERARQALGDIKADLLADTAPGAPGLATLTNIKGGLRGNAELLDALGDDAAARPLSERALAIYEASLGPTHHATAQSLNNLAINCYDAPNPDTQRSRQSLAAIDQRLAGE
jgi:hypothetical protein